MRLLSGMVRGAFQFDELPGDVEQRRCVCHAEERAVGRDCSSFIPLVVADKWRAGQIKVKLLLRFIKKSRFWLATFAAAIPIMRAIVDGINSTACPCCLQLHAIMKGIKLSFVHKAATNTWLVGRDDCAEACFIQESQCLERTGTPFPLTPIPH